MQTSAARRTLLGIVALVVVVSAALAAMAAPDAGSPSSQPGAIAPPPIGDVYDPVRAGEELPAGYRPLLERDRIEPIYNPVFTTAAEVDWPGDSLVIGVFGDGAAKAYPVTHLNSHEMVIDSLEGIPILVTW